MQNIVAFPAPGIRAQGAFYASMGSAKTSVLEEFVNRKNLDIGNVNVAPDLADHGADVPPGTLPGPVGAIQY
jgi:hypothetical protein